MATKMLVTVEVELTKTEGRFAPREDLEAEVVQAVEEACPDTVYADEAEYEVTAWDVQAQPQPTTRKRRGRTA